MRKNKMMRAASALLVAVLLTTSVISGTFAKYVTTADASDTARVAKFGVTVTASGSLFGKTYLTTTNDTPGADAADDSTVTVKSLTDKVVAPGTKSDENGIEFSITGIPEVDVNVAIAVTEDTNDVFLAPGFYDDVTTGAVDIAQVATKYEPVKYTLWQDKGTGTYSPVAEAQNVNLATLASKLEGLTATYDANADLSTKVGRLKITWAWDIDGNDLADTILGDLAAKNDSVKEYTAINDTSPGTALVAGMDKDYNLNTGIKIDITVTQVD